MASEWPDDGKSSKKKATTVKAKGPTLSESDSDSDASDKAAARRKAKARAKGPLFQVKWLRIVLGRSCCPYFLPVLAIKQEARSEIN